MKAVKSIIIVTAILAVGGMVLAAQDKKTKSNVKSKFDKGKNVTTVTLKTGIGGATSREVTNTGEVPQIDMEVSFSYPGEAPAKPVDTANFKFKSTSRYPVFQRSQNLMAVLDDDRAIEIGGTSYKSNSQTFYMEEIMEIAIPHEAMKKFSEAKTLKFFLGVREIKFRDDQFSDLRELAGRMAP
ncbi:MAG TPA: hypothetical protein VFZ40_00820 [Pyrinomonadaceae bacterium]